MPEKILDVKTSKSVKELRRMLGVELNGFRKTYAKEWSDWKIRTEWGEDTLLVVCDAFKVKGEVKIMAGRVAAFLDVPFYFLPFKDRYINMLKPMVLKALREKKVMVN